MTKIGGNATMIVADNHTIPGLREWTVRVRAGELSGLGIIMLSIPKVMSSVRIRKMSSNTSAMGFKIQNVVVVATSRQTRPDVSDVITATAISTRCTNDCFLVHHMAVFGSFNIEQGPPCSQQEKAQLKEEQEEQERIHKVMEATNQGQHPVRPPAVSPLQATLKSKRSERKACISRGIHVSRNGVYERRREVEGLVCRGCHEAKHEVEAVGHPMEEKACIRTLARGAATAGGLGAKLWRDSGWRGKMIEDQMIPRPTFEVYRIVS
ncbi:hypothetical protein IW262DRAFT_1301170 [Armillaria fumosa]|nr:hypothetical protein IW262DRAFT_1301170 [Armillaria fumosa]